MESGKGGKAREESMKAAASACEIAHLPEELLSAAISCTTPRDAFRAAAVSPLFRAAADSDAVWSCFLPRDLPPLADGELPPAPSSKKELFMRLSDGPVLLADGLVSMWLDRLSGAKCYMLSARALGIVWGSTPRYWRWIPLTDSRFAEAAELLDVCWLEFRGKIHIQMLSQNTKYAAYMVFKIADHNYGLDHPVQEAIIEIGEIKSTRQVCLQAGGLPPDTHVHVLFPQERADGWMELEMGEFFSEGADDGEVSIILNAIHGGHWKKGLIVHGIEIRAKIAIATCDQEKGGELNPSASRTSDGRVEPDTHRAAPTQTQPSPATAADGELNPSASRPSDGRVEPDTHRAAPTLTQPSPATAADGEGGGGSQWQSPNGHSPRFAFRRFLRCFLHPSSVEGDAKGSP